MWLLGARVSLDFASSYLNFRIQPKSTPWRYKGPPYKIEECTIESYDFPACSIDRYGGNSYHFSDELVELLKTSGNYGDADWHVHAPPSRWSACGLFAMKDVRRGVKYPHDTRQIEAEAAFAEKITRNSSDPQKKVCRNLLQIQFSSRV